MKRTILIVDDEELIRSHVRVLLEEEGYKVIEAASASAFRRLLKRPAPDMVLLDLKLPDADGLTLLPDLRKVWPKAEVAILTGHGTKSLAEKAFKQDVLYLQCKPFDATQLKKLVKFAAQPKPKLRSKRSRAKTTWKRG